MITLGKEYAHWVIEASDNCGQSWVRNVVVHVITKDIDRAIAICHEQHPEATIHAVRKTDRWDAQGIHIDLDPYGDEVRKDHPDLFWRGGIPQSGAGTTDPEPPTDIRQAERKIEQYGASIVRLRRVLNGVYGLLSAYTDEEGYMDKDRVTEHLRTIWDALEETVQL